MSTNALIFISIGLILFVLIICIYKARTNKQLDQPDDQEIDDYYQIPNEIELTDNYKILINQPKATDDINDFPKITDTKILKRINALVPHVIDTSRNLTQAQQLINTGKQIKNFNDNIPKNIVEVIIPPNAKLHKSKAMEGAYRGSYTNNGQLGQANLKPVEIQNLKEIKPSKILNYAADAMNIASIVVGQYYMSEIDNKLESLNENIEEIKDFLDKERLAKVQNLIANVSIVSKYKDEILSNKQAISQELSKLSDYEEKASDILTHINHEIDDISKKNINSFSEYKGVTFKLEPLFIQQNILVQTINQIASLKYILYKGSMSTDYCYEKFNQIFAYSCAIRDEIKLFHNKIIQQLNVDLENHRYLKNNILNNVARPIIEAIQDEWNYEDFDENLVNKINEQKSKEIDCLKLLNVFDQETKLIIHDGKVFYSPN